jgi:hypothetical protein
MRKLAITAAAGLLLSVSVQADISITFPATAMTDTVEIKTVTGAGTYVSGATAASKAILTNTADGALKLAYTINNGTKAYSAATGILVPIDPSWNVYNLSKATAISFEIKADAAGGKVNFLVGSDSYSELATASSAALGTNSGADGWSSATIKPTTAWTKVTIDPNVDLVLAPWYTDETDPFLLNTLWNDASGEGISIGKTVKNFQFQPVWQWDGTGATNKNPTGTIYIRNLTITGVSKYSYDPADHVGCTGSSFKLDQFASVDKEKPTNQNTLGGYWFAFADAANFETTPDDTAVGASVINPLKGRTWGPVNGYGALSATLEKNVATGVGGSKFAYHKYAGWAAMGTNFGTYGDDAKNLPVNFGGATAIEFELYAGATMADTLKWDAAKVPYITFKAGRESVSDANSFALKVPVDEVTNGGKVCIDFTKLKQPSYLTADVKVDWSAEDLTQFQWEMKIDDQSSSAIHTSGPNTFGIQNVSLYGLTQAEAAAAIVEACAGGKCDGTGVNSVVRNLGLKASYHNGLLVSFKTESSTANVDVLSLNGSKIAGFKTAGTVNNVTLPVSLRKGTYVVAIRAAGKTQVVPMVVAQ